MLKEYDNSNRNQIVARGIRMNNDSKPKYKVFLVVGEESGDHLGASLIDGINQQVKGPVSFLGVGGDQMAKRGVKSIFPLEDIAVMGLTAVIRRIPQIFRRISETVEAVIKEQPDVLVIIDSPDFTHNVAKRVRNRNPNIPVVNYVSPSVWVWRPGRAPKMARYVDQVLAILPFEEKVHKKLGGPKCDYVGHPLLEKLHLLRPESTDERPDLDKTDKPLLIVLPGSRITEIDRLLDPFKEILEALLLHHPNLEIILPAVSHLEEKIRKKTSSWKFDFKIVIGESEKYSAFRRAHTALAASGTVSLELALSGIPMVVVYKVDWIYRSLYAINRVIPISNFSTMVLPNLILGQNLIPEFLNESVSPMNIVPLLNSYLTNSNLRNEQLNAFLKLDKIMKSGIHDTQSNVSARLTLETITNYNKLRD